MASTNSVFIDVEQLKLIGENLGRKFLDIQMHQMESKDILRSAAECINLTGVDTTELITKLDEKYKEMRDRIYRLFQFLLRDVVPQYEGVYNAIVNNFNGELAESLALIMGMSTVGINPSPSVSNPSSGNSGQGSTSQPTGSSNGSGAQAPSVSNKGNNQNGAKPVAFGEETATEPNLGSGAGNNNGNVSSPKSSSAPKSGSPSNGGNPKNTSVPYDGSVGGGGSGSTYTDFGADLGNLGDKINW